MNKNAIKKFAIEARKKLIDSVTDKAGMLGITEKSCSEPIIKGADFEVYQTVAGTEVTLNKRQCEQRRRLASQIESRGFEAVVELVNAKQQTIGTAEFTYKVIPGSIESVPFVLWK